MNLISLLVNILGLSTCLVLATQRAINPQCESVTPGTFTASDISCNEYYYCDGQGVATSMSCPINYHFSEQNQGCDWPENVHNCPECNNIQSNTFAASTESCNKYYYCNENGAAFSINCPEGLYFSQTEQVCASPELVTDCPVVKF